MALIINNLTETGLYGEALTSLYARVEVTDRLCGSKIDFELYYFKDKASYQAGSRTVKTGDRYTVTHTVTTETLADKHTILKDYLVAKGLFTADQLTIVDLV